MEEKYNLIDRSVEVDETSLPKFIKNTIEELEKYDAEGNWIMYDGVSESLESGLKSVLIRNGITEKQFQLLLKKYRKFIW